MRGMKAHDGLKTLLIAGAIFLAPVAIYVSAYFACTTGTGTVLATGGSCRVYRSTWQALIFLPASVVESAATGRNVTTASNSW